MNITLNVRTADMARGDRRGATVIEVTIAPVQTGPQFAPHVIYVQTDRELCEVKSYVADTVRELIRHELGLSAKRGYLDAAEPAGAVYGGMAEAPPDMRGRAPVNYAADAPAPSTPHPNYR